MLCAADLSVVTGVQGSSDVFSLLAIFEKYPNSVSNPDAIMLGMMLHSMCIGPLAPGISVGGFSVFILGPRQKYPPVLLLASGSDM